MKTQRVTLFSILFLGALWLVPSVAQSQTTFHLPVTQNQANFRQFDFVLRTPAGWKYHAGSDLFCRDLKVMASNHGAVAAIIPTGRAAGFGNTVILRHTLGNFTRVYTQYSHLNSFAPGLRVGQRVYRGQVLGVMGKTGNSNGIVHLHFEIKHGSTLGNPWAYGLIPVNSQFGYMPANAGNATAASARAYGFLDPSSCYNNFGMLCNWNWQR